jgi:hypothetical protein
MKQQVAETMTVARLCQERGSVTDSGASETKRRLASMGLLRMQSEGNALDFCQDVQAPDEPLRAIGRDVTPATQQVDHIAAVQ